jgi:hypothetical protein
MAIINLETASTGKNYSYENDSWLNRHLGEPIDFDWGGPVRAKTLRWRWQSFCYWHLPRRWWLA